MSTAVFSNLTKPGTMVCCWKILVMHSGTSWWLSNGVIKYQTNHSLPLGLSVEGNFHVVKISYLVDPQRSLFGKPGAKIFCDQAESKSLERKLWEGCQQVFCVLYTPAASSVRKIAAVRPFPLFFFNTLEMIIEGKIYLAFSYKYCFAGFILVILEETFSKHQHLY